MEKLQDIESRPMFNLNQKVDVQTSYTELTAHQQKDLSPSNMMSGEVYRYITPTGVSFDVYAYLHIINGAVFEKKRNEKYKILISDNNGKNVMEQELKRDGDDVYKVLLRDLQIPKSHLYNNVTINFVDENGEETGILYGTLINKL